MTGFRRFGAKALPISMLLLCGLAGCKPTEKNYHDAYTTAYEAAQRRARETQTGSDGTMLEDMNAPRQEVIDGDTLYVSRTPVRAFEAEGVAPGAGLAVARYSMPTNARRHAQDLAGRYPGAFVAADGEGNYYVVALTAPSLVEIAPMVRQYRDHNADATYIGLSGPLVVMGF